MNNLYVESKYLKDVIDSVVSLCSIVSDTNDHEIQYSLIRNIIGLEQATVEFIDRTGFDSEIPTKAKSYRTSLIEANDRIIAEIKKVQLKDGYNFDELVTVLKLEAEHLRESTRLS